MVERVYLIKLARLVLRPTAMRLGGYMKQVFTREIAGRTLQVEIGHIAQLANASALIRYGDTVVLSVATASPKPREGMDFFPLSVEYEEKMYSVGKFPGGFLKREGRPTEHATITARSIDRGMRPLFPEDLRNDVVLTNTVLAVDPTCSPEFVATFGSALTVEISDIPFNGPIANANVGLVDGEIIINPTAEQMLESDLDLSLAGRKDSICMIEAGANEVPDEKMLEAIEAGHELIKELIDFIEEIQAAVGKEKFVYNEHVLPVELIESAEDLFYTDVKRDIQGDDKAARDERLAVIRTGLDEHIAEKYEEEYQGYAGEVFEHLQKKALRDLLKNEGIRVDGRSLDQIRPLNAEVDVLPVVHGSGLFERGETQVMNIVTLQPISKAQIIDDLSDTEYKRYMHQYNFPAYSVGEARASRSTNRREIGHGHLAERSLLAVLPDEEEFPYAIRSVSEVTMSNGSTSQASVASSSLALMASGVPIKRHVAGISAGLITDNGNVEDYQVFMDIQGIEDFYGDMDFKVAGTTEGITSIQVDIKVLGLSIDIITEALAMTKKGRLQIINDVMIPAISEPRSELSPNAPKIISLQIPEDKIGEVIGKGGKTINAIIEETGATIEIEDDGTVFISGIDAEALQNAKTIVEGIVTEPEPGQVYEGKVTRIMDFGAFVEYLPSKEGLVHISKLAWERVENVTDVVNEGDIVKVKVLELDRQGRINLSIRDTTDKPEGFVESTGGSGRGGHGGGNRNNRSDNRNRSHSGGRRDNRDSRDNRGNRDNRGSRGHSDEPFAKPREPRGKRPEDR